MPAPAQALFNYLLGSSFIGKAAAKFEEQKSREDANFTRTGMLTNSTPYLLDTLKLKRIFHQLLAWFCCLYLCGGQYALAQVTAWVGMAIQYSQADGVAVGLRKTFDGEHPCALCRAIKACQAADADTEDSSKTTTDNTKAPDLSKIVSEVNDTPALWRLPWVSAPNPNGFGFSSVACDPRDLEKPPPRC
jgi:hypothetical protein